MTLLTAKEVSSILRLSPSTVYDLERRGELPSVRIGQRIVRFLAEDIERLVRERHFESEK